METETQRLSLAAKSPSCRNFSSTTTTSIRATRSPATSAASRSRTSSDSSKNKTSFLPQASSAPSPEQLLHACVRKRQHLLPQTLHLPLPLLFPQREPSTITLGQSSTLTWSSQNATGGSIIPGIGTVSANGSQSISVLQSTTFTGTFWGSGGTAQCAATLTVTQPTTTNASCTFNNQSIPDGQSVTAYQSSSVPAGLQCISQTRTCSNGTLSGTYQFASCSVLPPATTAATAASCTAAWAFNETRTFPEGTKLNSCTATLPDGSTQTRPNCNPNLNVVDPTFTCHAGAWISDTGAVAPPFCTPDPTSPQKQTLSCPAGQTGTITQTRTSTCPGPTWGAWTTTGSTCVVANTGGATLTATPSSGSAPLSVSFNWSRPATVGLTVVIDTGDGYETSAQNEICLNGICSGTSGHAYTPPGTYSAKLMVNGTIVATAPITVTSGTAASTGSCTYKGGTQPEGAMGEVIQGNGPIATPLCDNGAWLDSQGANVCDWIDPTLGTYRSDFGCGIYNRGSKAALGVEPRHGKAPLTIKAVTNTGTHFYNCAAYSLSWGDGTTENYPQRYCDDTNANDTRTHTYPSSDSYTISYTDNLGHSNSAAIRIDGAAALAPKQSQLANALTALESALKVILQLL